MATVETAKTGRPEAAGAGEARATGDCSICLCAVPERACVLNCCGQAFCPECLLEWMRQQQRDGHTHATCPLCRAVIQTPRLVSTSVVSSTQPQPRRQRRRADTSVRRLQMSPMAKRVNVWKLLDFILIALCGMIAHEWMQGGASARPWISWRRCVDCSLWCLFARRLYTSVLVCTKELVRRWDPSRDSSRGSRGMPRIRRIYRT